jgi:pimeloyl-ACP methyl ester carboxylesterase
MHLDDELRLLSSVFRAAGDRFHLIGHSFGAAIALKAALAEKISTGKVTLSHTRNRLVKRRRAMLESKPPRNSQPETHPDDEWGRRPQGWRSHRMDRFPHA